MSQSWRLVLVLCVGIFFFLPFPFVHSSDRRCPPLACPIAKFGSTPTSSIAIHQSSLCTPFDPSELAEPYHNFAGAWPILQPARDFFFVLPNWRFPRAATCRWQTSCFLPATAFSRCRSVQIPVQIRIACCLISCAPLSPQLSWKAGRIGD